MIRLFNIARLFLICILYLQLMIRDVVKEVHVRSVFTNPAALAFIFRCGASQLLVQVNKCQWQSDCMVLVAVQRCYVGVSGLA